MAIISLAQIKSELIKSIQDKTRIYMIEHYLATQDLSRGGIMVPFKMFPRQKDLVSAYGMYQNNVTTKPRQAGISTVTSAFIACEIACTNKKAPVNVLIIANKSDMSKEFLKKIRDFLLQIPRFFWGNDYYGTKEKEARSIFKVDNQAMIELEPNGCKLYARSSGPDAARGVSGVKWLIFDEAAFIDNGQEVYAAAKLTTASGGNTIMISTPNGNDQLYYATCNKAEKGENNFHITKLKWFQDPRYNKHLKWIKRNKETGEEDVIVEEVIDKEGNVGYFPEKWSEYESNGYKASSPWYENMCLSLNNDEQKIAQELDVSFIGSGNNVVPFESIDYYNKHYVEEPLQDKLVPEAWKWRDFIPGHRYVMGVDASTGSGEDSAVIEIVDLDGVDENGRPAYEQVFEFQGKASQDVLGDLAYEYGAMYGFPTCVVDCLGGYGDATIIRLQERDYPDLFIDDIALKNPTLASSALYQKSLSVERQPGFRSKSARFTMLKDVELALRGLSIVIHSSRFTKELETWVWQGKGAIVRQDHMKGYHDDTITSIAMIMYVAKYSIVKMSKVVERNKQIMRSWVKSDYISNSETQSRAGTEVLNKAKKKMVSMGFCRSSYNNRSQADAEKAKKYNPNNPFALQGIYTGLFIRR